MTIDSHLVAEACTALGVVEIAQLKDGGQKVVRLVERSGERVVLKLVALGSSQPEALKRAQREVELLASLDSDYVVRPASDLVLLREPPVGATWLEEYLDGEDLSALLGPQWSWNDTQQMARDVAAGLAALHDAQVVHRDLSANNVRRMSNGRFKILDPGFARHTLRSGITVGGQPGTPGFMSPEHVHVYSGAPTAASDIFVVGILMYAALTGDLPVPYLGDVADYVQRLRRAERRPLSDYRSDLPADADQIVSRCLHAQPARRYRNGHQLHGALRS